MAAHRDSLRFDSLWQVRVAGLPDSVRYGTYKRARFPSLTVHLKPDHTFKVIYDTQLKLARVEGSRAVRAEWTSTWKREGDVFIVSREPETFELTGEPPLVEKSDAGMVPLDSRKPGASMLQHVVDKLDTCFVAVSHDDLYKSVKVTILVKLDPYYKDYFNVYKFYPNNKMSFFHKPYSGLSADSTHHTSEEGRKTRTGSIVESVALPTSF